MITTGRLKDGKGILLGKPYVFDVERDFMRVEIIDAPVAFTDYLPRQSRPEEYLIVDFDKDGRLVGVSVDGVLAAYAHTSPRAWLGVVLLKARLNVNSVSLISKALAKVGADRLFDAVPKIDSGGRVKSYAY